MTFKKTKHKDKKRSTPKDVENRKCGVYRDKKDPDQSKKSRKPTPNEVRGNNEASVKASRRLTSPKQMIRTFPKELSEMNRGKVGRPYVYADCMFGWILSFMGYFNLTYVKAAGLAGTLLEDRGLPVPSRSTVHKRILELVAKTILGAPPEDSRILCRYVSPHRTRRIRRVAVDSSGFSLSDYFKWSEEKWGVENKDVWLKLHVLVDIDTCEIIAYILTYNDVGDPRMLPLLMELAKGGDHRIGKVYADGAYGSDENWKILSGEYRCDFVTSFRSDTAPTNNGCPARGEAARVWCSLPYEEWVKVTGYGIRWKVEGTFSDLKRLTSEVYRSRTDAGHMAQSYARISAFNEHKTIRAEMVGVTGNGVVIAV